jgi:MFS family permease
LFSGLSRNTFLLALSSLFADISTEMIVPVLPMFLTQTLKVSASVLGLVEGIAGATQNITQGLSGSLSDKLQHRKSIALAGYFLAAIGKPLMGMATIWQGVLGGRFIDRLGAGTRSAPRDALIASSVAEEDRGRAFGLEGAGDNAGACLGPLLAVLLFVVWHLPIRMLFYWAVVPGLLATALFGIGNSSNAFLILETKDIGASLTTTILVYAGFNLVAALISYPAGSLSDRLGRRNLLVLSLTIFFITYLGFATTHNVALIGFLFAFYGLYQGIIRSVGKALASDYVSGELRASAIGWYNTTIGLSGLGASLIGGRLWDTVGHSAVFFFGAAFAAMGALASVALIPAVVERAQRND